MIKQFKTLMREHFPEFPLDVCGEWEFTDPTVNAMWLMYQICNAWHPIETAPKTGRKMLLSLVNIAGKRRTIVGFFVEKFTLEDNSEDWDSGEEKDGTYYWKEGFYESMESHDDFSCLYADQSAITHWRPLPIPPLTTEGGV